MTCPQTTETRPQPPFGEALDETYPDRVLSDACALATPFNVAQLRVLARRAVQYIQLYNSGLRHVAPQEQRKHLWKVFGAANGATRRLERELGR